MAANNWLNTSWVSMEILRILDNTREISAQFNTDWDKDYKKDFPDCVRYTLAARPTQRNLRNSAPVSIGNRVNAERWQKDREVRDLFIKRTPKAA